MDARAGWLEYRHGGWQRRRKVGGRCLLSLDPVCSHSNSSNLTFPLESDWAFVETEDWRADIEAKWSEVGADDCERFPIRGYIHSFVKCSSVTLQRDGYIQMMRGSSHMLCRWVSGRLRVR